MQIILSFIFLLLLFLTSWIFSNKIKGSKLKLPPSPPRLPIIGNFHQFGELPHRCLHKLSKNYGSVMLLHLGSSRIVVVSSSEAASEVLKTRDLDCCSRPITAATRKLSYDFKDIAFAPYGEYWREMRKIAVIELFSLRKVESFRYIREEETEFMVKKLSESCLRQSPVDLSETLFALGARIIFRVAFGVNFSESEFFDMDWIERFTFEAETLLGSFSFSDLLPASVGWLIDFASGRRKRLNRVFEELDRFYQRVIDDHLKPGRRTDQDHPDFVDVMLNMVQEHGNGDSSSRLTIDQIKGVLMDIFLAGVDTSPVTMIWAMAELARNPRLMKKAQDEIRGCIGEKGRITEEDLPNLHYLKLVIKETLRLHPAAPVLVPRETMAHVKLQGYDIPPKTQLQINAWAIARDPKLWKDPDEFIPERFIDSPIDFKGRHFELLPFGAGRRICPGMAMAIPTLELGLANLLHFFDWKFPDGMTEKDISMEEAGTLVIFKKVPLQLVPVRHH